MRGIVPRFPKFAYAHKTSALRGPSDLRGIVRIGGFPSPGYSAGMLPTNNSRPKRELPRKLSEKEIAELEIFCKEYSEWIWETIHRMNEMDESDAAWDEFLMLTDFPDRPALKKEPMLERSKNHQSGAIPSAPWTKKMRKRV